MQWRRRHADPHAGATLTESSVRGRCRRGVESVTISFALSVAGRATRNARRGSRHGWKNWLLRRMDTVDAGVVAAGEASGRRRANWRKQIGSYWRGWPCLQIALATAPVSGSTPTPSAAASAPYPLPSIAVELLQASTTKRRYRQPGEPDFRDQALVARMLRVANSSFYGLQAGWGRSRTRSSCSACAVCARWPPHAAVTGSLKVDSHSGSICATGAIRLPSRCALSVARAPA